VAWHSRTSSGHGKLDIYPLTISSSPSDFSHSSFPLKKVLWSISVTFALHCTPSPWLDQLERHSAAASVRLRIHTRRTVLLLQDLTFFTAIINDSDDELNTSRQGPALKDHASTSMVKPETTGETVVKHEESKGSTRRRTLERVVIPKTSVGNSKATSGMSSVISVSSASSLDNGGQDWDTPATSIAVTPEGSTRGKGKGKGIATDNKRKRSRLSDELDEEDIIMDADTALAEALQREEYEQGQEVERPTKRLKQSFSRGLGSFMVDDSDDSDAEEGAANNLEDSSDALSTVISISDDDSVIFKKPAMPVKGKSKRPVVADTKGKRRAGLNARNSIGRSLNTSRLQSEESEISAFTELSSDEEFEASEAEEAEAESEDEGPLALHRRINRVFFDESDSSMPRPPKSKGRKRGMQHLANTTLEEELELLMGDRKSKERRKLERAHPTIKTMWKDLEAIPVIKPQQAAQPPSINRKLKSFQLEGLDWMIKQEKTQYKGGLLGDEMGMGKTIQAVSLIMSDHPAKDPTLVMVPPVALMQWANEIKDYTDGKLKVLVYHGQNAKVKGMKVKDLKTYDVIMISYNSLESLYRKQTKGWSRGEDLVKEASPIHAIHFHRLILDEAHSIKSRTTGVAKACFALKSTYKWCLSGTPVQNRIGEFFSLLRFLEVRPFADYFCKRCPCAMVHWSVDKNHRCSHCKHASMEHVSVFNQELLNPLTQSEDIKERERAMDKLHLITARIMLRRMKRDYVGSMELPPKEVVMHREFFGEIERDFSSSIMSNTGRQFDTYVSRGVMLNNYANIFGLIMQMRQVSNHPDLLLKKHAHEGQNVLVCNICDEPAEDAIRSKCKHDYCRTCIKSFVQSVEDDGGEADCPRCHVPLEIDFDRPEIVQDEDAVKKSSIVNRIRMEDWTSSTKIEMLVYDLWKLRSKKQTVKSIIFSQFTSMLQLVEWRLRRAGFNTVMLDGSMTPIQRQRSIDHFMTNADCEIFLVSLKAGGVALNLTEASRVFIIDPWWNPAAEWQSADRCHRIGQKRPCVITRLCIEDSVESRIVMLQEKKANMIAGTVNNDKVAMEKLTPEDMQFLFRGS